MRSWVKALLISAVTLLLVIVFLPSLAKPGLNRLLPWVLEQADFENIEVQISKVSWYQLTLNNLSFSSPENDSNFDTLSLQQLEVSYSPFQVLSGKLHDINIEKLSVSIPEQRRVQQQKSFVKAENQTATVESSVREDEIILPNAKEIFALLPMDILTIKKLSISHPQIQIDSQLQITTEAFDLQSVIKLTALNKSLIQSFTFNDKGLITAQINTKTSAAPIFNLQGQWIDKSIAQKNSEINDLDNKMMSLSWQQSTDIESLLALINTEQRPSLLVAETAIQVWSQTLNLPKIINDPDKIFKEVSGEGLFQVKINDFSIVSKDKKDPTVLSEADFIFNSNTSSNHIHQGQQNKSWQFIITNFDLKGTTQSVENLAINIQQQLKKPLHINCSLVANSNFDCQWEGVIQQQLIADNINNKITIDISGDFKNSPQLGSQLNLRQHLNIDLKQNNQRWPRLKNITSGDLNFSAIHNPETTGDNNWHWQLNLPFGLNNETHYLETLPNSLAKGELSKIDWQLLPDWQLQGINTELTDAKPFSILVNDLSWTEQKNKKLKSKKKTITLQQAKLSCDFDWLKLQYSPQLRGSNTLENLPLSCNWNLNNTASQWEKWPVPALTLIGEVYLSSLDFSNTQMRANAKLTGLNQRLDFSLQAQHDFSGMQKGAAQLYLNNLNLEWQELGLIEMMNLTQAQLLGGTLSAQGWLQWEQYQEDIFNDDSIAWRWQPDLMLRVDDLAGVYNNTTAWDDVDFQMAIRRPFYENFKLASQISANSINPGIEVSNILARSTTTIEADFSKALIVIEEIHSDVLGGRIEVPLIRFDTSQEINAFGIKVEGLQISQLAALEADSGITATGTLDGVLPIILLPEGPQVPAGTLYARAPGGIINYQNAVAAALKDSDPTVGLAMEVLENFHYDKLQTDITYQPTGELKLGLQFQGNNPTFFDGQATHLNLNLDYNLLDLLESLRISNDIVQKLENKYQ
jgi:hypothetical protein